MQAFTLSLKSDGWHISNGRVDFGPYSTRDKASDSAAELTRQSLRRHGRYQGAERPEAAAQA